MTRIHIYRLWCRFTFSLRLCIHFPVLWHGSSRFSSPTQHTTPARHRKWVKTHSDHRSSDLPCEWLHSRKWLICLMVQKQEQWREGENCKEEEEEEGECEPAKQFNIINGHSIWGACKWVIIKDNYVQKGHWSNRKLKLCIWPLWPLTVHNHFNAWMCPISHLV